MKQIIPVLLSAFFIVGGFGCSYALSLNSEDYPRPIRVACVGDSITAGIGLEPDQNYPAQLQKMLGPDWDVSTFIVCKRAALRKGDFSYWLENAFTRVKVFHPDAVVILVGANDCKLSNWKYRAEYSDDYADLVTIFRNLSSKPRIYICHPVPEPTKPGITEAAEQEEIKIINHLSDTIEVREIDRHRSFKEPPQLFPDRVHPNAEGSFAIAKIVYQALTGIAYAGKQAVQHSTWNGYHQDEFVLANHKCRLIKPKGFAPGNPWIWRPEFFGAYDQADRSLLKRGFALAYMDMNNIYGSPSSMELMNRFYDYLTAKYGLSSKTTLFGFSRGGLYALNWSALHPNRVACLYLDAPVCDFKSWPAGFGKGSGSPSDWRRLKQFYGFNNDREARAYRLNPIDNLKPLAAANIPILSVCGGADRTVPYPENTAILKERYEALGGYIQVIVKPGCDHHPHSLINPQPIVTFVLKNNLIVTP